MSETILADQHQPVTSPLPKPRQATHSFKWDQAMASSIDITAAMQFVQWFAYKDEEIFIQTFADGPDELYARTPYTDEKTGEKKISGPKFHIKTKHWGGKKGSIVQTHRVGLDQLETELQNLIPLNIARGGIFFTVNALKAGSERRSADAVRRIRAVFIDFDGQPLPSSWPLEPTAIVESSSGRYHAYVAVDDVPLEEFSTIQKHLAKLYGGDPAVHDLPRVMRLPGFYHGKSETPFLTKVIGGNPDASYSRADLLEAFEGLNDALEQAANEEAKRLEQADQSSARAQQMREELRDGDITDQNTAKLKYAQIALMNEVAELASTGQGGRNAQLYKSAAALGNFIGANVLDEDLVRAELESTALAVGLGSHEIKATLESGLTAGKKEPRDLSKVAQLVGVSSVQNDDLGRNRKNAKNGNAGETPLPLTAINRNEAENQKKEFAQGEIEPKPDWYIDPSLSDALPTQVEWQLFTDLPSSNHVAPAFDPELVPLPVRGFITDLAELSGLPQEAFLAPLLCAVGSVIGKRVAIRPKQFDTSWIVVPNLWGMVIGRPSVMKTFAIGEAVKPLHVLERSAREEFEEGQAERDLDLEIVEAEIKAKKKSLELSFTEKTSSKKKTAGTLTANAFSSTDYKKEVLELQQKADALKEKTSPPRYVVNSSTVEKLGEIMREKGAGGLLVLRDELNGFFGEINKAGREGEKQFYLEAWNGTGQFSFDRIGRGTIHIPNMCVSVIGGIQPSVIDRYIGEALEQGGGADGFLQRFQLTIHILSRVLGVDRAPSKEAKQKVYELFEKLDALDVAAMGITIEDGEIPTIGFSAPAQQIFNQWRDFLEQRLMGDEFKQSPMFESHLGKFRSLIPSLALINHLIEVAAGRSVTSHEVGLEALTAACEFGDFLEGHAKITYDKEVGYVMYSARNLLKLIVAEESAKKRIKTGMRLRSLERSGWKELVAVKQGFAILAEHGIACITTVMTAGSKKPTHVIAVNPDLDMKAIRENLKGDQDG